MSALIAFINSHDGCKVESVRGNRLLVSSVCVDAAGNVSRPVAEIAATLKAARNWLGY